VRIENQGLNYSLNIFYKKIINVRIIFLQLFFEARAYKNNIQYK